MSYPVYPGYGSYYHPGANNHPPPSNVPSGRASSPTNSYPSQSYHIDARQSLYGQAHHGWSSSDERYGNSDQQLGANNSSQGGVRQTRHPGHQEQPAYVSQAPAGNASHTHYRQSAQARSLSGIQGLNSLVFASGLESRSHADGVSSQRSSSGTPTTAYNASPANARSPAQGSPQSRPHPSQATQHMQRGDPIGQRWTGSTATALAGAVSRRISDATQTESLVVDKSASSAMGHTTINSAATKYGEAVSSHGSARSSPQTSQLPSSIQQGTPGPLVPPTKYPGQMSTSHADGQTHNVANTKQQLQRPPMQQNFANLANAALDIDNRRRPPEEERQQQIPNYIDPSKVFNPYHREHEQKKREAAAREADEQRRAVESEAEEKLAAAAREARPKARPADAMVKPGEIQQRPRHATPGKQSVEPDGPRKLHIDPSSVPGNVEAPGNGKEDMAFAMKAIMEQMKALKDKDPAQYQTLLAEMQKGDSYAVASVSAIQLPDPGRWQSSKNGDRAIPISQLSTSSQPRQMQSTADGSKKIGATNGYSVIIENNPDNLPDLGRFPAERRIRSSYKKSTAARASPPAPPFAAPPHPAPAHFPTPTLSLSLAPIKELLTPRKQAGTTVWPELKRNALVEAAVKNLKRYPENASAEITAAEVMAMLDQHPSYGDLCEMLERKGLKFHRGHFARELLANVPALKPPPAEHAPMHAPPHIRDNASAPTSVNPVDTAPAPPRPATSLAAPPPPVRPMRSHPIISEALYPPGAASSPRFAPLPHAHPTPPSQAQGPQAISALAPSTSSQNLQPKVNTGPVRLPLPNPTQGRVSTKGSLLLDPPPGSKEAMSRKRDFADLVDLTDLSQNDNYVVSSKRVKEHSRGPKQNFHQYIEALIQTSRPPQRSQPQGLDIVPVEVAPLKFNPIQQEAILPSQAQQERPKTILTKPIMKAEALRKSYYDPKTVARDILIAAGRHPQERPLNAHLAGLLGVYTVLDSDLNTFDWDAIDPGGPPAPKVSYVDIPAGPPRFRLGQRVDRFDEGSMSRRTRQENAENRTSVPAPTSVSRFASQSQQLPKKSTRLNRQFEKQPSRLSHATTTDESLAHSSKAVKAHGRGGSQSKSTHSSPVIEHHSTRRSSHQQTPSVTVSKMDDRLTSSGKRRGRPPGAKNKVPSVRSVMIAGKAVPTVQIPLRSTSPAQHNYRCRWRSCQAQLHNLPTLQRHVGKVHKPEDQETSEVGFICLWRRCRFLEQDEDGAIVPTHPFDSYSEWLEHIKAEHLHPIGIKYGDGPSTTHIGKRKKDFNVSQFLYQPHKKTVTRIISHTDPQSIAQDRANYIADEHGRTTTSMVSLRANHDLPRDTLLLTRVRPGANDDAAKAEAQAQKSFFKTHGNEKMDPGKSAEEILRAMKTRKEKIGPGLDRGGCTLINEARRSTLIQNPGVSREVDCDY